MWYIAWKYRSLSKHIKCKQNLKYEWNLMVILKRKINLNSRGNYYRIRTVQYINVVANVFIGEKPNYTRLRLE